MSKQEREAKEDMEEAGGGKNYEEWLEQGR